MSTVTKISRDQPSAPIDIVIQQGADFTMSLGIFETIDPRVLLDLTGWAAYSIVRANYFDPPLLSMNTANGRITLGTVGTPPNDYNVLISVNSATTDALTDWELGIWDIEFYDPFGHVYRWVEGRARLSRAATR